jgi:hypothetical protein
VNPALPQTRSDDPLHDLRIDTTPTTVRGHPAIWSAKLHFVAWEEPAGRLAEVSGPTLSIEEVRQIADGLGVRADGGFAVTSPPAGYVQTSDEPGYRINGTNPRAVVYGAGTSRGIRVDVTDGSQFSPGASLSTFIPARLVEVRGHHAVVGSTVQASAGAFDDDTMFMTHPDEFVQWLEPGNTEVTVTGLGVGEADLLAVANGLVPVERAGWDQLVAQAPSRFDAPRVPLTVQPPTYTGEEAAIADVFSRWLSARTADDDVAAVEDGANLRDTFAAAITHPPASDMSGRVDQIRLVSADRALVTFSMMVDPPNPAPQLGSAVKIGGHWFVTQVTACQIVELGPVKCPAK